MSRKRVVAVIPARMGSSRFPGKPLVKIMGLPMVEHVRRRVCLSDIFDDVYVATCDNEIKEVIQQYGGKVIMTADTHVRCTDRVAEASYKIEADIIVIPQGDEPLFDPGIFESLIKPMLEDDSVQCTNLLSVIHDKNDLLDIDICKAVLNQKNHVMYFSRAPIPYFMVGSDCKMYRLTGLHAFNKAFLQKFSKLPSTPLEVTESIDFLRILEHGYSVFGVIYPQRTIGVDRRDDIEEVERILREDPVQQGFYKTIMEMAN